MSKTVILTPMENMAANTQAQAEAFNSENDRITAMSYFALYFLAKIYIFKEKAIILLLFLSASFPTPPDDCPAQMPCVRRSSSLNRDFFWIWVLIRHHSDCGLEAREAMITVHFWKGWMQEMDFIILFSSLSWPEASLHTMLISSRALPGAWEEPWRWTTLKYIL